jgi:hypothetical protein
VRRPRTLQDCRDTDNDGDYICTSARDGLGSVSSIIIESMTYSPLLEAKSRSGGQVIPFTETEDSLPYPQKPVCS